MGDILTGLIGWWKLDDQPSSGVFVPPPSNINVNVVEDGSGNYFNYGYGYRYIVVAFKVVDSITYYSTPIDSDYVYDSGNGDSALHIDISWTGSGGSIDGYKVLIYNDQFGASGDYTYTVASDSPGFTDGDGTESSFIYDNVITNPELFADSSGSGYTGSGVGNLTKQITGLFGKATSFAPEGHIDVPYSMPSADFSQAAWFYFSSDGGNNYLIDEGGNNHWIQKYIGKIRCGLDANVYGTSFFDSNTSPSANNWHHVVTTYNATTHAYKLYIDGVLDKSSTYTASSPGTLTIGNYTGTGYTWLGNMQDVRIYNRALSQADIDLLYAYRGATSRRRSSVVCAD